MISNINSFNSYYNPSSPSKIDTSAVLKKIKEDPNIWRWRNDPPVNFDNSVLKPLEKGEENKRKMQKLVNTIKQLMYPFSKNENIQKPTRKWIEVCGSPW